jgi:hypothetical protein
MCLPPPTWRMLAHDGRSRRHTHSWGRNRLCGYTHHGSRRDGDARAGWARRSLPRVGWRFAIHRGHCRVSRKSRSGRSHQWSERIHGYCLTLDTGADVECVHSCDCCERNDRGFVTSAHCCDSSRVAWTVVAISNAQISVNDLATARIERRRSALPNRSRRILAKLRHLFAVRSSISFLSTRGRTLIL